MEAIPQIFETESYRTLESLIHEAQRGNTTTLPAIRELLNSSPELWQNVRGLATQVEWRWLQTLAGNDVVAQEVLARQVATLKVELAGPTPSPLEKLLVERVAICWLQLQDAELRAEKSRNQCGAVPDRYDTRITKTQKRFLDAAKSLVQVQKLLRPKAAVVNIATNQQVNIA